MNEKEKTKSIEYDHGAMVGRLMKSPEEIQKTLSVNKIAFIHATLGVAGELFELLKPKDEINVLEESGDILFYIRDLRAKLPWLREYQMADLPNDFDPKTAGDDIVDVCKKICIANQEWDQGKPGQPTNRSRFQLAVDYLEIWVSINLESNAGFTRNEALEHNMNKLEKGNNARYKEGYSDEANAKRADKVEA